MLLSKAANPKLTFSRHRLHGGLFIHHTSYQGFLQSSKTLRLRNKEREREMEKGEGLKRGAWTDQEDKLLTSYIMAHGEGKWTNVPKVAGLNRSGKSCRLRWLNYLRPDIKRGDITRDEEDLIIRLHKLLGNRWSLIAGRIPGRTDNEIKNYWNTTLSKKLRTQSCAMTTKRSTARKPYDTPSPSVIQTKPWKCKNVVIRHPPCPKENLLLSSQIGFKEADLTTHFTNKSQNSPPPESRVNVHENQFNQSDNLDVNLLSGGNNDGLCSDFNPESRAVMDAQNDQCQPIIEQVMFNGWNTSFSEVDMNSIATWEMDSLALLLESEVLDASPA